MSGRYVNVETQVWVDDSDVEMCLGSNNAINAIDLEKRIHEIYIVRCQDKVGEVNRLLDQLFLDVLDKKV